MTHPKPRPLAPLLLVALVLAAAGCEREIVPEAYVPNDAHDAYRNGLALAGLARTALGRDWERAAETSLRSPVEVTAPFREAFYVDATEAFAVAYRFPVKRGQRTEVTLAIDPPSDWRIFMDLFRSPDPGEKETVHVASGGEGDLRLAFEPRRDGNYVLRLQSELLRGGSATVEIRNVASLEFPVAGRDTTAIGSSFGVPREGGRRAHHGVDIFAPRHTEVLATSRARVRKVDDWKLGGRVVWLEDPERDLRLYFAHLETQEVIEGTWVGPGDRIGTVGNSGNARTTPTHLHFGVYVSGEGPLDPYPFLHQPRAEPPKVRADAARIGKWARTRRKAVSLVSRFDRKGETLEELPPRTVLRVLGGAGSSYRVELPNGMMGFLPALEVEDLEKSLDSLALTEAIEVRERPRESAAVVRRLDPGARVEVYGRFENYSLVESERHGSGWVLAP
jgi:peptidoglycan LD-endopeptidase LytH